jgi:hypothetical protein
MTTNQPDQKPETQRYSVRSQRYRWLLILVLVSALVLLVASLAARRGPGRRGVIMSFSGYTNLPNNSLRFALFSISNQDSAAIVWRGSWVEVEGSQSLKAPVMNPNLPFFPARTLRGGGSVTMATGEPVEEGRWRFSVLWGRYTLKVWLLDFASKHNLPMGVGRFSFLDPQQILNPTNYVTNSSPWLTK